MSKDLKVYGLFSNSIADLKNAMQGVRAVHRYETLFIYVLKDLFFLFLFLFRTLYRYIIWRLQRIPRVTQAYLFFPLKYSSLMVCFLKALLFSWVIISLIYSKDKVIMLCFSNNSFIRIMMPLSLPP